MNFLYKGTVHPWHCDVMGHMNVRHYMAIFDDAAFQLLAEATGWYYGAVEWRGKGWADVNHNIDYLQELTVGSMFEVVGGIINIGNSSYTAKYIMKNKATIEPIAKLEAKVIHFDLVGRKSLPINDQLRQRMESYGWKNCQ